MREIAVVMDKENNTCSIFEAEYIKIYCKEPYGWLGTGRIPACMDKTNGIGAVRSRMTEIISSLGSCRTIVGKGISGIPYNLLDVAGFNIFEIEGSPEEFLNHVAAVIDESNDIEMKEPAQDIEIPKPEPTGIEGDYRIDLILCQKCRPEMSSKKILLPFLRSTVFHSLEVLCSHVPPWLDMELEQLGLLSESERITDNHYKVTVFHKTCSD